MAHTVTFGAKRQSSYSVVRPYPVKAVDHSLRTRRMRNSARPSSGIWHRKCHGEIVRQRRISRAFHYGAENLDVRETLQTDEVKLFIANLHYNATEELLECFLSTLGPVKKLKIHRDNYNKLTGTADVVYEDSADAMKALHRLDNVTFCRQKLKVRIATQEDALVRHSHSARNSNSPHRYRSSSRSSSSDNHLSVKNRLNSVVLVKSEERKEAECPPRFDTKLSESQRCKEEEQLSLEELVAEMDEYLRERAFSLEP